jgi:TPR repeat protein
MYVAGLAYGQLGDAVQAKRWLQQADAAGHPQAAGVIAKYGL